MGRTKLVRRLDGIPLNCNLLAVYSALTHRPMAMRELRRVLVPMGLAAIRRHVNELIRYQAIVEQVDKKFRITQPLEISPLPHSGTPVLRPSGAEPPRWTEAQVRAEMPRPFKRATAPAASERATMLAARINVPASNSLGELTTGALERCQCGNATPFKYGTTPMCPPCARK